MDRETRQTALQLAALSSVGIAMVLAVVGCFFLGRWLDQELGTDPALTFVFLLIGIAAGFRNIYTLLRRYVRNERPTVTEGTREPERKGPPAKKA